MKTLKSTLLLLVTLLTYNLAFSQTIESINKVSFDDYKKLSAEQQAAFKKDFTSVLKADTNFIKYNKLSQDNELAFASRDRSKPLVKTKSPHTTKEEWIAIYQQEGLSNPALYYNNQIQANKQLKAAVTKYPIFSKLDAASLSGIIKDATVTPPEFYQKLARAITPKKQ